MKYQKERCLQCERLTRPTNLQSRYPDVLDATGKFFETEYWFCSDKCYEDAFSRYLDNEYLPKYWIERGTVCAPNLRKDLEGVVETYSKLAQDADISAESAVRDFGPLVRAEQLEFLKRWKFERDQAVDAARLELRERVLDEYLDRFYKEHEKFLEQEEKEEAAYQKEMAAIEAKQKLEQEMLEKMKPREIPESARFSHTHILGSSGQGKSSLIIQQFRKDMCSDAAVVIVDPKGTLVRKLSRYPLFRPEVYEDWEEENLYANRLCLIDPTVYVPALNMFAPPKRRYEKHIAQQLENNIISLFQYVFSSKDSALTDKQLTCFSYGASLMLTIPDATIHTFLELLSDPPVPKVGGMQPTSPFKAYIDKLGPTARTFFYNYFYDLTEYAATKDQIATRIFGMLRYPVFDQMFSTAQNRIDMFHFLQTGRVVLISCPAAVLGVQGATLFARYMVALTLQAAFERMTIPKSEWTPAYLVIDEAQLVVDEIKTQELLQLAREFQLGVVIAHQQIKGQISEAIFSTLSANTRIKYAGTTSYLDAYAMSRDMRCEPEFILNQRVVDGKGHFACFCGGVTEHPFSHELDFGEVNDIHQMDDANYREMVELMRHLYGADTVPQTQRLQPYKPPGSGELSENVRPRARVEEKPEPTRPAQEPTVAPTVSKSSTDPHIGTHTEPASKWGDS